METCIHDISFIVIALNEGFVIQKCLESILRLDVQNCELICVDSNSEDNTLQIMTEYAEKIPNTKVFKINGNRNAAIARNIGIKYSHKKYIFFVDGDTEIKHDFIYSAITKMEKYGYAAITGDMTEYQYSSGYKSVLKRIERRAFILAEKDIYLSGGNFMARRYAINDIGLFDENLKNNQDFDYTLRLSSRYKMGAIPQIMCIHHTIPYDDRNRIKEAIVNRYALYIGRTMRKNIKGNFKGVLFALKAQAGHTFGIFFYLLASLIIFSLKIRVMLFIPVIFIADVIYGIIQKKKVYHRLIMHYIEPLFLIKGFLFFKIRKMHYNVIRVYPKGNSQ
jgi:glycosyltransferase involved in cell wall biosynthesis